MGLTKYKEKRAFDRTPEPRAYTPVASFPYPVDSAQGATMYVERDPGLEDWKVRMPNKWKKYLAEKNIC